MSSRFFGAGEQIERDEERQPGAERGFSFAAMRTGCTTAEKLTMAKQTISKLNGSPPASVLQSQQQYHGEKQSGRCGYSLKVGSSLGGA